MFGVRLSASALDFLAPRTNTRVSPHDRKHLGDMQEYRTGTTHLSHAGIGWLIKQISASSVHFQLKSRILPEWVF